MLSLGAFAAPSFASISKTVSDNFKSSWELSATGDNGKAVLTYGFNTFLISEDFARAYHSSKNHYASIKNKNGEYSADTVKDGKWSEIEIRHVGSSITYKNNY